MPLSTLTKRPPPKSLPSANLQHPKSNMNFAKGAVTAAAAVKNKPKLDYDYDIKK